MKEKIICLSLCILLVVTALPIASATSIQADKKDSTVIANMSWTEITYYGQQWDEDADGPNNPPIGDWENHGAHAIRLSHGSAETGTAWYMFDIEEEFVDEGGLQVGLYFCDWAALPMGGPDFSIFNWESDIWTTWEDIGTQDDLLWVWKSPLDSNQYVLNGLVWVKIYAQILDDTVVNTVGVKYIPGPDLDCDGSLSWRRVRTGLTVTGSFDVKNIGYTGTSLNWKVISWPDWGTWSFNPSSGYLYPEDGKTTVQVSVVAPEEKRTDFTGEIIVVNLLCEDDYEIIPVSLKTPRYHSYQNLFSFQILQHLMNKILEKF